MVKRGSAGEAGGFVHLAAGENQLLLGEFGVSLIRC